MSTTVKGYMGSVTIDGDVVIISKRMRGETRIDLAQVSGISIERAGLGMKAIRFMTAGGTAGHRSPVLGSSRDLANDPQALTFRSKHLAEFQAFAAEAEARRAELS